MAGDDVFINFGADSSGLEAASAIARAEMNAAAAQVRSLAAEISKLGAAADSDLIAKMKAAAEGLTQTKDHAAELKAQMIALHAETAKTGEGMALMMEQLRGFGELAGIAFSAEAIKDWIGETTEAAEKIERLSAQLGASPTQIQNISAIAKLTGADLQEMSMQLERLQLSLAKTDSASSPAAAAIKSLNIDLAQFRTLTIPGQLDALAEAFSRFSDGPTKTAAAMALLGRTGADMIPYLDRGREGLAELSEVAQRTGAVLDESTVASFAQTREAINEMGLALSGLSNATFGAFNQAVRGGVQLGTDFAEMLRESAVNGGLLADAFGAMSWTIKEFEQYIGETVMGIEILAAAADHTQEAAGAAFQTLGHVIADVFSALGAAIPKFFEAIVTAAQAAVHAVEQQFIALGTVIKDTLALDFGGAQAAFGSLGKSASEAGGQISGAFKNVFDFSDAEKAYAAGQTRIAAMNDKFGEQIKTFAERAKKEYAAIWGPAPTTAGGDAALGGPAYSAAPALPAVPQMSIGKHGGGGGGGGGDDGSQAAEEAFRVTIQEAQDTEKAIRQALDEAVKQHQITWSEWLSQSTQALDHEQDAIQDAADKAVASAALSSQQKIAIAAREQHELAQIAMQEAQDQAKAAEASAKQWEGFAGTISGAFNSQLHGLIEGTETFRQAMAKISEDLLIKFIEAAEKMAIQWLIKEATQTSATTAGVLARSSAEAGGAGMGEGLQVAAAMKSIETSAASAGAGVFGFLAPLMGPFAAGPAAGAEAAVLGMTAGVASADIGMWDVPQDQLALIHRSELIMPATQAGAFRDFLTGAPVAAGAGGDGDGGGPSRGGTVHSHAHFHMGAVDGASASSFFRMNQRAIANSVAEATRHGVRLGRRMR